MQLLSRHAAKMHRKETQFAEQLRASIFRTIEHGVAKD
jgi:hypothetical protein